MTNFQSIISLKIEKINHLWRIALCILDFSIICLFVYLSIGLFVYLSPLANADTMSNSIYTIRWGNFNMVSGKPTNSAYKVSYTSGQVAPGLYTGSNYIVRAGFQYIYSLVPFSFKISNTSIDFGTISPTYPVTRANTLEVTNQSAGGYAVTGYENHSLLIPAAGASIPDTTCDNGLCTETTSGPWTGASSLTYGFGYRCDPVTTNYCSSDFNTADYFKQFADISKTETPQSIFSGSVGSNQQAQITYKVNISATQPAGHYTNIITYIATPTF